MTIKNRSAIVLLLFASLAPLAAQPCPEANPFFSPREIGRIRANRMSGLSGMAASRVNPEVLWVHNGEAIDRVFAVTREGRPTETFTLAQSLADAEDMAIGPGPVAGRDYLYIGDIGDAARQRQSVIVVRAPEPPVQLEESQTLPLADAVPLSLEYPDTAHDAEALLIDPLAGDLLIVTKQEQGGLVFRARKEQLTEGNNVVLEQVAVVPLDSVTGGDISRDGQWIALRNETTALMWHRRANGSVAEALATAPVQIPLAEEGQGEALAFDQDNSGYLTVSEGEDQPIYFVGWNRTGFTAGQPLGAVTAPTLAEVSGIAASRRHPGVVWMHNDGTNQVIFAVSTNGNVLATFRLRQPVVDVEDAAVGPGEAPGTFDLFLADIGDNAEARENIRVIRVPEPELPEADAPPGAFARESVFTLEYPDGPHNAEALLVDSLSGDIYIATKEEGRFRLFRARGSDLVDGARITLELVHSGELGLVSAGDMSADGLSIVLRREETARLWRRNANQSVGDTLAGPGEEIPVIGPPEEPNGEAISLFPEGGGYVTFSEGEDQTLYFFQPSNRSRLGGAPVRTEAGWRLRLLGCPGGQVALEVSPDLLSWTPIAELTLEGEETAFDHSESHERLFYRLIDRSTGSAP